MAGLRCPQCLGKVKGLVLDKRLFKNAEKVFADFRAAAKAQIAINAEEEEWDQIDLMRELVSWADLNIKEIETFQKMVKKDSSEEKGSLSKASSWSDFHSEYKKLLQTFRERKQYSSLYQYYFDGDSWEKKQADPKIKSSPHDRIITNIISENKRNEWDTLAWWKQLFSKCVPECKELERYRPTGRYRKIGPTISPGIQVDIINTAHRCYCRLLTSNPENFELLFPDESKKADFENSVYGDVIWNKGTKSHSSVTIRTRPRYQDSEGESVEAILQIYQQIRDWVRANLSE